MIEQGQSRAEVKADVKAEKARAKAMRPWFKKKRLMIPLVFVAIMVIVAATSSGGDDKPSSVSSGANDTTAADGAPTPTAAESGQLFPGRVDAKKEDQEREIGQSAQLSGYTATVNSAGFKQSLSDFEEDGYIEANVTIENRDSKAQAYNYFDWKIQTPSGTVIDPTFASGDTLKSGDLVTGGKVSGRIVFEVGSTKGVYYLIYKPDAFDGARGIWKVTV